MHTYMKADVIYSLSYLCPCCWSCGRRGEFCFWRHTTTEFCLWFVVWFTFYFSGRSGMQSTTVLLGSIESFGRPPCTVNAMYTTSSYTTRTSF